MARRDDMPPESDRFGDFPHPRENDALIGHDAALAEFHEAWQAGRLPQAWIVGGPEGVGKATFAWRAARFLFAHRDHDDAARPDLFVPKSHPAFHQTASLSHGDLFLLRREWNDKARPPKHFTDIRVDDARRAMHMFQRAAGQGGYRVCIVDCAEDLNSSAANALLKLIEEPPPRSVFFIIAHKPSLVIPTIRSRCRKLLLRPLGAEDLTRVAATLGVAAEAGVVAAAAARSHGSAREMLRILQGDELDLDRAVTALLERLPALDWRAVQKLADEVAPRDREVAWEAMLGAVFDWLSRQLRSRAAQGPARLARFAEVWEKVAAEARETAALNLDRRPLVLSIFSDLAAAARD